MQQCTGSVRVWLLAGPIKSNWPNVTLWSVFNIQSQLLGLIYYNTKSISYIIIQNVSVVSEIFATHTLN